MHEKTLMILERADLIKREPWTLTNVGFKFLLQNSETQIKTILFEYLQFLSSMYSDKKFEIYDMVFSLNNSNPSIVILFFKI